MSRQPLPRRQRGITLVEAGIALAISATLAGLAAPSLQRALDTRRLEAYGARFAADLQLARTEALARGRTVRVSFPAGQACYVVHTGAADACRCDGSADANAVCDAGANALRTVRWSAADRLAVSANVGSIGFDARHGTASPTATLRVAAADGRVLQHVVNVMGRVRSCAAGGDLAGVQPC